MKNWQSSPYMYQYCSFKKYSHYSQLVLACMVIKVLLSMSFAILKYLKCFRVFKEFIVQMTFFCLMNEWDF